MKFSHNTPSAQGCKVDPAFLLTIIDTTLIFKENKLGCK